MEQPRRPPHYRSAHTRVVVKDEEDEAPPVADQIESGARMAMRIRFFIKGILAILVVLLFSLIDSPIRPYMVGTAIVMGLIIVLWPLLKKTEPRR